MSTRLLAPFLLLALLAPAQEKPGEWGLIANKPAAFQGYTLFAPLNHKSTYLINMAGEVVHQWEHEDQVGNSVYLLPDGRLLRPLHVGDNQVFGAPPFGGGRLQIINWDGEVEWDYTLSSATRYQHHDVHPMPNGNVLALAWELKSRDEALAAGRSPDLLDGDKLFPESIVEIRPTGPTSGDVVWEWHLWDHLVQDFDAAKANYGAVAEHPELLDINFINGKGSDWNHSNGIDYNPELDQIIINMRSMSEFFILDHSTTIAEARSHAGGKQGKGGDFLYRWGNPQGYLRGRERDRTLYVQHNAHWIRPGLPGAGDILVFNNGDGRPGGNSSSVDQLHPPVTAGGGYRLEAKTYGPKALAWTYSATPKTDFYSSFISGSQRLPNGNTLICSGATSRFFEVTPEGEIVWEYRSAFARPDAPVSMGGSLPEGQPKPALNAPSMRGVGVFRATRYAADYPGLRGKTLQSLK
jgi:hypothetical protein